MKIYIAGHMGLVGSALTRTIETRSRHNWVGKVRSELDLLNRNAVFDYLADEKPDAVIIAAAKVGGIMANLKYPVDFLSQNLQIQCNIIDAAHSANIPKLLFLGSSCAFPKFANQPIKEEYLLSGALEETNEAYALAKISGIKLVQAYRKQFGYAWISAMPSNVYGPGDNFKVDESHVMAALIRKFHEAKLNGEKEVLLWGTGKPKREFLYSDDLADACLFLLEHYDDSIPINIGVGYDVEILELAELVKMAINYSGRISWDVSKPDGTPRKLLDTSKLNQLGWIPKVTLTEGVTLSYDWFVRQLDRSAKYF
jgi:GDP-L-fucose synthase